MNHSTPSAAAAFAAGSSSAVDRITRSTPSAPTPDRRWHSAATVVRSRSTMPSGSGTTRKSFSVPLPLGQASGVRVTRSAYGPPTASLSRRHHHRGPTAAAAWLSSREELPVGKRLDRGHRTDLGGTRTWSSGRRELVSVRLEHRLVRVDELLLGRHG